jgi:hypothetical protein
MRRKTSPPVLNLGKNHVWRLPVGVAGRSDRAQDAQGGKAAWAAGAEDLDRARRSLASGR